MHSRKQRTNGAPWLHLVDRKHKKDISPCLRQIRHWFAGSDQRYRARDAGIPKIIVTKPRVIMRI